MCTYTHLVCVYVCDYIYTHIICLTGCIIADFVLGYSFSHESEIGFSVAKIFRS